MKKTLCIIAVMMLTLVAMAQQKVAILETVDKAQNISYGKKLLLRSSLTTAISNTPGYEGFDRVDMASIASEQEFQRTGYVSDSQIKQLGVATGAAYVLVAEAAWLDEDTKSDLIITARIIDVETFGIKSSAEDVTGVKADEMKKMCAGLAKKLLGPTVIAQNAAVTPSKPAKQEKPKQQEKPVQPVAPVQQVSQPVMPVSNISVMTNPTPLTTMADGTVLYVAMSDEDEKLNYDEACEACRRKGEGWRLPTLAELKILEKHKKDYSNLNTSYRYWAIDGGLTIDMSNGFKVTTKKSVRAKVRCVKEEKK